MVGDQDIAVLVDGEAGDLERGIGQFTVPEWFFAVVLHGPDAACGVVAVEVGAVEFRVFLGLGRRRRR